MSMVYDVGLASMTTVVLAAGAFAASLGLDKVEKQLGEAAKNGRPVESTSRPANKD